MTSLLVDKSLIEKAKEKLGDENAFIMAELLELENWDEKNLKGCCPYHREDTPSFVYNKKDHRFKCFGCGTMVDIIDVLMANGNTFLDAAKILFEKAGFQYSFGLDTARSLVVSFTGLLPSLAHLPR